MSILNINSLSKQDTGILNQGEMCAAQNSLSIASIVSSAISLIPIPAVRLVGALAGRVCALCSVGFEQKMAVTEKCIRAVPLLLGGIAVVTGSPVIFVVAMAIDALLHLAQTVKAFKEGEKTKGALQLGIVAIQALVMAAILAASWQIMFAAAALSACLLLVGGVKAALSKDYVQAIKQSLTMLLTLAGAVSLIPTFRTIPIVSANFEVRAMNGGKRHITIEENGKIIARHFQFLGAPPAKFSLSARTQEDLANQIQKHEMLYKEKISSNPFYMSRWYGQTLETAKFDDLRNVELGRHYTQTNSKWYNVDRVYTADRIYEQTGGLSVNQFATLPLSLESIKL